MADYRLIDGQKRDCIDHMLEKPFHISLCLKSDNICSYSVYVNIVQRDRRGERKDKNGFWKPEI